tara:strand:+ start:29962 stop:30363 length:402 start_codon:yes stop_codon:yes gene_type:complete
MSGIGARAIVGGMDVVNLQQKLDSFSETWVPKVVGSLNGQYVKVAKLEGEYVWHAHEHEDEMFLVMHGELQLEFRERTVTVRPGEFCIVPRGVEHRPVARELVSLVLFEPQAVRNTGDAVDDRTIEADDLEHI